MSIILKSFQAIFLYSEDGFTSKNLLELGIVDDVIEEPLGGAHRDHHRMAANMKNYLKKNLKELVGQSDDELLNHRYDRFRKIGVFHEAQATS